MGKKKEKSKNEKSNYEEIVKIIEHQPALIRIGKKGVTTQILDELVHLLQKKRAVKVKILQNAGVIEAQNVFNTIETKIGFKMWRKKGNTAIFIKKRIES